MTEDTAPVVPSGNGVDHLKIPPSEAEVASVLLSLDRVRMDKAREIVRRLAYQRDILLSQVAGVLATLRRLQAEREELALEVARYKDQEDRDREKGNHE